MSIQMIAHYSMPMTATPDIYEADTVKEEVFYLSVSSSISAILTVAMIVFVGYMFVRYMKRKTKVASNAGMHIWVLLLSMLLLASSAKIERCEASCPGERHDMRKTVVREQSTHSLTPFPDVSEKGEEISTFSCAHF